MIISLHLPKTAGISFGRALHDHFEDALFPDYDDIPMTKSPYDRAREALLASLEIGVPGIAKCIHGHFLPVKYLLLSVHRELKFITWMRDPVERMLSHYHYWKRSYDPETVFAHHRRFIEENWSLERFCLGPEFQNIYSQYLWGFPLARFAFVGIVEFYVAELECFSRTYLGRSLPCYQDNAAGKVGSKYKIDPGLRSRIAAHHWEDMEIYQHFLRARQSRTDRG